MNDNEKLIIKPPSMPPIYRTPLTNQAQKSLYFGILNFIPVKMLQLIPPLQNYSLNEIYYYLKGQLKNPPLMDLDSDYKQFSDINIPFDIDEDFIIVTMIRMNSGPFSLEYIKKFSFIFKTIRTIGDIRQRYEELRELPVEDLDEICYQFSRKTTKEYLSYKSVQKKVPFQGQNSEFQYDVCSVSKELPPPISVLPEIDQEIERLSGHRNLYLHTHFGANDLAILRGEKFEFIIKQSAVIIGRNTETSCVDIDLSYFVQNGCRHISKRQAILSFQKCEENYEFFIENIGERCFRVNGFFIPQGKICRLNSGALIDFSDILFLFVVNEAFVDRINHTLRQQEMSKSFFKKKKK